MVTTYSQYKTLLEDFLVRGIPVETAVHWILMDHRLPSTQGDAWFHMFMAEVRG